MMTLQRERWEKIKNCAWLGPDLGCVSMTYEGHDGRRYRCPYFYSIATSPT